MRLQTRAGQLHFTDVSRGLALIFDRNRVLTRGNRSKGKSAVLTSFRTRDRAIQLQTHDCSGNCFASCIVQSAYPRLCILRLAGRPPTDRKREDGHKGKLLTKQFIIIP